MIVASSVVELVNLALIKIGAAPVASLSESLSGRTAERLYPSARDQALNEGTWNCATKRVSLPQDASDPPFGYANAYVLPGDFIRLVNMPDRTDMFRIENGRVLSDLSPMNIVYVFRQTDVTKMDPLLQKAIASLLASELAVPISNSQALRDRMAAEYRDIMSEAKFADATQAPTEQMTMTSWSLSRSGRDDYPIDTEVL